MPEPFLTLHECSGSDQVNAQYCSHYAVAMEIVRMQMSCI